LISHLRLLFWCGAPNSASRQRAMVENLPLPFLRIYRVLQKLRPFFEVETSAFDACDNLGKYGSKPTSQLMTKHKLCHKLEIKKPR
jgi:hypothetical protein